jgi:hypothetical protein
MAKSHRDIVVLMIGLLLFWAAPFAHARPVLLQVEGGETAFVVDDKAGQAWWVLETCKRALPIENASKSQTSLQSQLLRDQVELGSRQVELRQQFRFHMASVPASVEVYNSVRGGWSPVPVRVEPTCHQSAECRSRMELPECPSG